MIESEASLYALNHTGLQALGEAKGKEVVTKAESILPFDPSDLSAAQKASREKTVSALKSGIQTTLDAIIKGNLQGEPAVNMLKRIAPVLERHGIKDLYKPDSNEYSYGKTLKQLRNLMKSENPDDQRLMQSLTKELSHNTGFVQAWAGQIGEIKGKDQVNQELMAVSGAYQIAKSRKENPYKGTFEEFLNDYYYNKSLFGGLQGLAKLSTSKQAEKIAAYLEGQFQKPIETLESFKKAIGAGNYQEAARLMNKYLGEVEGLRTGKNAALWRMLSQEGKDKIIALGAYQEMARKIPMLIKSDLTKHGKLSDETKELVNSFIAGGKAINVNPHAAMNMIGENLKLSMGVNDANRKGLEKLSSSKLENGWRVDFNVGLASDSNGHITGIQLTDGKIKHGTEVDTVVATSKLKKWAEEHEQRADRLEKEGKFAEADMARQAAYNYRTIAQKAEEMGLSSVVYHAIKDKHGQVIADQAKLGHEGQILNLTRLKQGSNEAYDLSKKSAVQILNALHDSGKMDEEQYQARMKDLEGLKDDAAVTMRLSKNADGTVSVGEILRGVKYSKDTSSQTTEGTRNRILNEAQSDKLTDYWVYGDLLGTGEKGYYHVIGQSRQTGSVLKLDRAYIQKDNGQYVPIPMEMELTIGARHSDPVQAAADAKDKQHVLYLAQSDTKILHDKHTIEGGTDVKGKMTVTEMLSNIEMGSSRGAPLELKEAAEFDAQTLFHSKKEMQYAFANQAVDDLMGIMDQKHQTALKASLGTDGNIGVTWRSDESAIGWIAKKVTGASANARAAIKAAIQRTAHDHTGVDLLRAAVTHIWQSNLDDKTKSEAIVGLIEAVRKEADAAVDTGDAKKPATGLNFGRTAADTLGATNQPVIDKAVNTAKDILDTAKDAAKGNAPSMAGVPGAYPEDTFQSQQPQTATSNPNKEAWTIITPVDGEGQRMTVEQAIERLDQQKDNMSEAEYLKTREELMSLPGDTPIVFSAPEAKN